VIGLVIVSHSARLADGVLELAREMAGPEVRMAAAGGMDMPGRPLGTDAALVARAIEEVDSGDGVLLLMDLGSALLSAEMALEMLEPDQAGRVRLAAAPLVEGAIAAAVQARLGSSLEQAALEAEGSLAAKRDHLGVAEPSAGEAAPAAPVAADALVLRLEVRNRHGLHARPAARFVQTVGQFKEASASVRNLANGRGPVPATSINALATLGLACGQALEVAASGPQSAALLAALKVLAEDNFGDPPEDLPVPPPRRSCAIDRRSCASDRRARAGFRDARAAGWRAGPGRHPGIRRPGLRAGPAPRAARAGDPPGGHVGAPGRMGTPAGGAGAHPRTDPPDPRRRAAPGRPGGRGDVRGAPALPG
jgi:phosphocarrier protein FPr